MKTDNAMQLKAKINNKAKELKFPAQIMLQNYLMECFLERLSKSEYAGKFIIKGGLLIASLVGLSNRTTMDIDVTVKNIPLNENEISKIIAYVCSVPNEDDFVFYLDRVEPIRDDDEYQGFRAFLIAEYEQLHNTLTVDVTTGDSIYPDAVMHGFSKIFDSEQISLFSYPAETVLAEKLETILSRNVTTTRPRDFYDVYALSSKSVDYKSLKTALEMTCRHRQSEKVLYQIDEIITAIRTSDILAEQWQKYTKKMPYAAEISFEQTVNKIEELLTIPIYENLR
ncbi:MAG: nucleotidyl transferase AbiEii/AbiGii toxin family protein [Treponema sp.]|nr:nucleotidyl transferase AbiEii/AbiGii toxin family protein [Treponema sp.]